MKITDALMGSGGLQENARWKEIRVVRGGDEEKRQILVFNLEGYLKSPEKDNLALQPGDQIFVEARRQGNGKTVLQRLFEVLPLANLFFLR
jgi:protein involved in polysaccharide export with SLBB domain